MREAGASMQHDHGTRRAAIDPVEQLHTWARIDEAVLLCGRIHPIRARDERKRQRDHCSAKGTNTRDRA